MARIISNSSRRDNATKSVSNRHPNTFGKPLSQGTYAKYPGQTPIFGKPLSPNEAANMTRAQLADENKRRYVAATQNTQRVASAKQQQNTQEAAARFQAAAKQQQNLRNERNQQLALQRKAALNRSSTKYVAPQAAAKQQQNLRNERNQQLALQRKAALNRSSTKYVAPQSFSTANSNPKRGSVTRPVSTRSTGRSGPVSTRSTGRSGSTSSGTGVSNPTAAKTPKPTTTTGTKGTESKPTQTNVDPSRKVSGSGKRINRFSNLTNRRNPRRSASYTADELKKAASFKLGY